MCSPPLVGASDRRGQKGKAQMRPRHSHAGPGRGMESPFLNQSPICTLDDKLRAWYLVPSQEGSCFCNNNLPPSPSLRSHPQGRN